MNMFCYLRINGNNVNLGDISTHLNLIPTTIYKKGDIKANGGQHIEDCWQYSTPQILGALFNIEVLNFIEMLLPQRNYLKALSVDYSVRLYFSVYAESEQISLSFPQNIVLKLGELELPYNVYVAGLRHFYEL